MLLYSLIILISGALIAGLNIIFHPGNEVWYYYVYWTAIFIVGAFLIDALVALIIRRLPNKWFTHKKKMFRTSMKEMQFYRKIKINKWKDKVPELGGFTDFHKDKFENPNDNKYVGRFIMEACYGVAIHIWSVPFGFLILLLDYRIYLGTTNFIFLTIGLPVAIVNAFLIVLPAFILKNNLYRLINIYERNERNENK